MPVTAPIKLWDIFLLTMQVIVAEIVIVVPLQAFKPSTFLTLSATVIVGSIWWIVGYQRLSRTRDWASLQERFSRVTGWIMLGSALGGLSLILLPWAISEFLGFVGIKIPEATAPVALPSNVFQLPLAIAGLVLLGPFSEELIFRGLLLDWPRQKMAVWPAALIISLFFAFLHNPNFKNGLVDWNSFGLRFIFGIGASLFAIRYRSLRPSFVMHATFNGCICLASVLRSAA
jgi:membrane protease YdiL (CAAX protease family)